MQKFSSYLSGVNTLLTSIATFIVLGFLVFILNNPELVDEFATFWRELIANYFAGYLIWVVTLVTVFNIFIAFTPYGKITLGQDGEKPEFSRFSWFLR